MQTDSATTTPTREQRIAYKRIQVLAEMNESIHILTSIESLLDEINQCIVPTNDTDELYVDSIKTSTTQERPTLSDRMNQLLMELQKWDDDF